MLAKLWMKMLFPSVSSVCRYFGTSAISRNFENMSRSETSSVSRPQTMELRFRRLDDDVRRDGRVKHHHLLQVLRDCRQLQETEDIDRLKQIVRIFRNDTQVLSNNMRAALFEFYARVGDFKSAQEIRQQIKSPFVMYDFIVMDIAKIFLKSGRITDAIEVLTEELNRPGRKEHNASFVEKNTLPTAIKNHELDIVRCVNEAAEVTKDPSIVDQVLNLCLQFRGLKPTNRMLGPKIKVHLLNNDLNSALEEFQNIVKTHKQIPWMGQLMKSCIETGRQEDLHRIIESGKSVRPEEQVTADLAFAFMKCGLESHMEQATRLIQETQLPSIIWEKKIRANAAVFIKDNDIANLERMVSVTKVLSEVNRDEVYRHLIRGCVQANDKKRALQVFADLQSEGVIPSSETLSLVNSLEKSSKRTSPLNQLISDQFDGNSKAKSRQLFDELRRNW